MENVLHYVVVEQGIASVVPIKGWVQDTLPIFFKEKK